MLYFWNLAYGVKTIEIFSEIQLGKYYINEIIYWLVDSDWFFPVNDITYQICLLWLHYIYRLENVKPAEVYCFIFHINGIILLNL